MDCYTPEGIAARLQMIDLTVLYSHAVDRRQWNLMEHVFHNDAICDLGVFRGPWRDFIAGAALVFDAALSYTSHQLGNFLFSFEDNFTAHAETYCTAHHRVRADAPAGGTFGGTGEAYDLIGGLRYIDRFEKRNDRWAIAERRGLGEWHHIYRVREADFPELPQGFRGQFGVEEQTTKAIARWVA